MINIVILRYLRNTVAHKRNAKPNYLTLNAYNSLTTNARIMILYSF